MLKDIYNYDEILLIGSEKALSVKTIKEINWRRKILISLNLSKYYQLAMKVAKHINFRKMKDPNNPCLFCNIHESGYA